VTKTQHNDSEHLTQVLDFGLTPEEVAALEARPRLTLADIEAMIVSEEELLRLGRWGGEPPPQRWFNR
jgi:hypothetical protein